MMYGFDNNIEFVLIIIFVDEVNITFIFWYWYFYFGWIILIIIFYFSIDLKIIWIVSCIYDFFFFFVNNVSFSDLLSGSSNDCMFSFLLVFIRCPIVSLLKNIWFMSNTISFFCNCSIVVFFYLDKFDNVIYFSI